jgi:hypothetical protein
MSMGSADLALSQGTLEKVQYRIAHSRADRAGAFRLVYNAYLTSGLSESNPYEMRVTPYHLLRSTQVFLAICDDEPMFTMSLIMENDRGLPMEGIYPEEVDQRRRQGLTLAEVSCLADRRAAGRGFFPVFLGISRLLAQFAWHQGVDELVIAVHPRHARFYRRLLNFQPIGPLRSYPSVRNRPAVALALNFPHLAEESPRAYRTLFEPAIPVEELTPRPIGPLDQAYFCRMVDDSCLVPLGEEEGEECLAG